MLLLSAGARAQLVDGAITSSKVITAEGVSASTLYARTLESFSAWAGSYGADHSSIEAQDKEEGLIIFNSRYYIGLQRMNTLYSWLVYANFTMKVQVKDGRAKLTLTSTSADFEWSGNNKVETVPLVNLFPKFTYKSARNIWRAAKRYSPEIPGKLQEVEAYFVQRIGAPDDDDF